MVTRGLAEPDITTFVAQGELTADELFTAYSHFLDRGASRLTLWDMSGATFGGLTAEAIRTLARRIAEASRERRPPGKAAIVCAEAVDFGLVRMLATHLELGGHLAKIAPFRDLESAKAWLKKDAPG